MNAMDELFDVWVYDEGWNLDDRRLKRDTVELVKRGYEEAGYETHVHPSPRMTARAWVEEE